MRYTLSPIGRTPLELEVVAKVNLWARQNILGGSSLTVAIFYCLGCHTFSVMGHELPEFSNTKCLFITKHVTEFPEKPRGVLHAI